MRARVTIVPRPEVLDPQGRAVAHALEGLGFGVVKGVRVGRIVDVELSDGLDRQAAEAQLEQMTRELLANLVIEDFRIDWLD
jgi:phosphoribosylformylglycinamidine synthase